jgi:hypothetical protein
MVKWSTPCFYSSIELKSKGSELIRIQATRAVGALFCGNLDAYLVYNTGASVLKWSGKAEQKLMGVVEGVLASCNLETGAVGGIMFGTDMETMCKLMTSDGGYRRQYYKPDDTFPVFHYIPLSAHGKLMMSLLCSRDKRDELRRRLGTGLQAAARRYPVDGLDGDTGVLFGWELDMAKLRRFKNGLEITGERGCVLCFDFQAEALRRYFDGVAEIESLDSAILMKELVNGN